MMSFEFFPQQAFFCNTGYFFPYSTIQVVFDCTSQLIENIGKKSAFVQSIYTVNYLVSEMILIFATFDRAMMQLILS